MIASNRECSTVEFASVCFAFAVALAGVACESPGVSANEGDEAKSVEAKDQKAEGDDSKKGERGEKGASSEPANEEGESGKETAEREAPETATVGKPAPDFTLEDTTGEKHTLSEYRGELVVLEWTSTECPYVVRHYDEETMTSTIDELGGDDEVRWLAIDSSHFATPEASKKWKEKYGVEYSFLMDPEGEVGEKYQAKTTPHMYVIDKEGILRYKGAIDDDPQGRSESPTNYVVEAAGALQDGKSPEKRSTKPYGCSVKYGG